MTCVPVAMPTSVARCGGMTCVAVGTATTVVPSLARTAYVSIRQHTSAYVSIRQHTSAYVSIRQVICVAASTAETTVVPSLPPHTAPACPLAPSPPPPPTAFNNAGGAKGRREVMILSRFWRSTSPTSSRGPPPPRGAAADLSKSGCESFTPCHAAPQVSAFVLLYSYSK
jgi:hypothetical protein